MSAEQREQLVNKLIQKLEQSGYVSIDQPPSEPAAPGSAGGKDAPQVQFEVTDKAIDFLGFKTLKDLLGSAGQIELWRARYARAGHWH